MPMRLGPIKKFANSLIQEVRVHRRLVAALAAIFLLQFYFVRELLAVELFFALGFAVVFMLGGPAYLIGSAACHGWSNLEEVRQKPRNLIEKNRSLDERRVTRNFMAGPGKR